MTERNQSGSGAPDKPQTSPEVKRSDGEWREQLGEQAYHICREQGTERAFTGEYWNTKTPGVYRCRGCAAPLFDSVSKYDSGSGWPSFFQPLEEDNVESQLDRSHGMTRREVHCSRCGCHLGHVFEDGPQPTGLRYCINSASLALEERES